MRIKKIQRPQIETTFNAVNDPWYSLNVKLPTKIFPFFLSCFRRERGGNVVVLTEQLSFLPCSH